MCRTESQQNCVNFQNSLSLLLCFLQFWYIGAYIFLEPEFLTQCRIKICNFLWVKYLVFSFTLEQNCSTIWYDDSNVLHINCIWIKTHFDKVHLLYYPRLRNQNKRLPNLIRRNVTIEFTFTLPLSLNNLSIFHPFPPLLKTPLFPLF